MLLTFWLELERLRRELLYLKDAIIAVEQIQQYLSVADINDLPKDKMRFDAVLRNLQIASEAVKQIPEEMRLLRPEIPWTSIAGIRNRLVHHYFSIDPEIIIDVCENHLNPLLKALHAIAGQYPELDLRR